MLEWGAAERLRASALRVAAWEVLSPAERERASRIVHPDKHVQFVATRALLRRVLAGRLGIRPEQVGLSRTPAGKPTCETLIGTSFSVSHTSGLAVVALGPVPALGVDVERTVERERLTALAARMFSRAEHRQWLGCPVEQRADAFYRLWTRKEAYLKALGTGIFDSVAVHTSRVPLDEAPTDPSGTSGMSAWRWRDLELPVGFRGALCWRERRAN